jgi:hypothetical protein
MRGESKVCETPGFMIVQRPLCQAVELATLCIGLELPVPAYGVKLRKPLAECRQFVGRKVFNLAFDASNSTHSVNCFPVYQCLDGQSSWSLSTQRSQSLEGRLCPRDVLAVKQLWVIEDNNSLQTQLVRQFEFAPILAGLCPEPLFDEPKESVQI